MRILTVIVLLILSYGITCQVISIPEKIVVSKGKCTVMKITFNSMPKGTVFEFGSVPESDLNINQTSILFSKPSSRDNGVQNINFCASATIRQQIIRLNYFITSNSSTIQQANNSFLTIEVISNQFPPPAPLVVKKSSSSPRCLQISMQPTVDGDVYFTLKVKGSRAKVPTEPIQIKKKYSESKGEFNSFLYSDITSRNSSMNYLVDMTPSIGGIVVWKTRDVVEATNYQICFFIENKLGMFSSLSCTNVSTPVNDLMMRAYFNFTHRISLTKLNILLCFLTASMQLLSYDIMTIDGLSCNPSSNIPTNYHYNYKGVTKRTANDTIIYFSRGCNTSRNQKVLSQFSSFWNMNGVLIKEQSLKFGDYDINWVQGGRNLGERDTLDMLSRIGEDNNNISFSQVIIENSAVTFVNITSPVGLMYIVIVSNQTGTDALRQPTPGQIIACRNSLGGQSAFCGRIVISSPMKNQTIIVNTTILSDNISYAAYFTLADQYPRIPITQQTVKKIVSKSQTNVSTNSNKNYSNPTSRKSQTRTLLTALTGLLILLCFSTL